MIVKIPSKTEELSKLIKDKIVEQYAKEMETIEHWRYKKHCIYYSKQGGKQVLIWTVQGRASKKMLHQGFDMKCRIEQNNVV